MNIGYACLTVGVPGTKLRGCTIKNATPHLLSALIQSNLKALSNILDYDIKNGIKLFRISSDIIPFASHPVNMLKWWVEFKDQLRIIGNKALSNGMRLSMHPGQYTVLNSANEAVVERAVADLEYHARFMDMLGLGEEHKIILHLGGIYGDKPAALKRFVGNYRYLDESIRRRLAIENDDRHFVISDVLSIGEEEGIPVVFDNLHHQVNPDNRCLESAWIERCGSTWRPKDGPPKLHYSQQDANKRAGSHSATLNVDAFLQFYRSLPDQERDIMVEVKDKNLSAIKCINAIASPDIERLEREWERYKYLVMEHSPAIYHRIGELLQERNAYPVTEFYGLIDRAMTTPIKPENAVKAARHLWDCLKDASDEKKRQEFEKSIEKTGKGKSAIPIKRLLWGLAKEKKHLSDSLYFMGSSYNTHIDRLRHG